MNHSASASLVAPLVAAMLLASASTVFASEFRAVEEMLFTGDPRPERLKPGFSQAKTRRMFDRQRGKPAP